MAMSIASATVPSFAVDSSNLTTSSRLLASKTSSSSLRFPHQFKGNLRRVCSPPQRQILTTRVEAAKQSFSSFEDLLANSEKPVLVDFYATWCGPCQFMAPVLDEVSAKLVDKIQIVKIDAEKYPKIADQYKIEALPTFIIFKDGKPCDRFEGALAAPKLIERIENTLNVKK